ncbi:MAG: hypothetical protein NTY74_16340 [Ignavibacteriae bacterium]|nr:hypothetical protein [Ignavibacteriota bacterium]
MAATKKERNKTRHKFLLTMFPDGETKVIVNNFVLIKYFSGLTKSWEVSINTPEAYDKSSRWLKRKKDKC